MSDLLMFTGTECVHCHEMEPLVERLEQEENVKVDRMEVWHNAKNAEILQSLDKGFCGGIPFFYNKNTKKWICGSTSYENLKKWAMGK
ncbi:MAG: hypothetical protein NT120_00375 [Candidatus Aenigmarchaeota archaeon]|nr:hypothetical protein [Candidatus Aenigmarchaeota archaeon]